MNFLDRIWPRRAEVTRVEPVLSPTERAPHMVDVRSTEIGYRTTPEDEQRLIYQTLEPDYSFRQKALDRDWESSC